MHPETVFAACELILPGAGQLTANGRSGLRSGLLCFKTMWAIHCDWRYIATGAGADVLVARTKVEMFRHMLGCVRMTEHSPKGGRKWSLSRKTEMSFALA